MKEARSHGHISFFPLSADLTSNFFPLSDIYLKKISEQEAQITALKEQQKDLEANESINVRQRKLWADVVTLLESKIASHQAAEAKRAAGGEYADVLQLEVDRILL